MPCWQGLRLARVGRNIIVKCLIMKQVLVVVDVQKDFVDGSLGSLEAVAIVPGVCELIKSRKWDGIVVTLDTHGPDYMSSKEGQKLPVEHCIKGTPGWELDKAVAKALAAVESKGINVVKVEKPTFGKPDLMDYVRASIDSESPETVDLEGAQIVVCGLCTDICVISNALILKAAGWSQVDISAVASCCAGTSPARHQAALDSMASCQIEILP